MRHWKLLGSVFIFAGCVTDEDVGRQVIVAAPLWFLAGWGALGVLLGLWRRARGPLPLAIWPSLLTTTVLVIASLTAVIAMTADNWKNLEFASVLVWGGASYLTLLLLAWRIWFHARPTTAFSWAHLPALAIFLVPALPMALGLTSDWLSFYAYLIFPGFYGVPTAVIFGVLLVEAIRASRRPTAAEAAVAADDETSSTLRRVAPGRWPAGLGLLGLVGGLGIIVATFLPITTGPDGYAISSSRWFILEPLGTGLLVAVLGLLLPARVIRLEVAGAMLIGAGGAELLMFVGYLGDALPDRVGVGAYGGVIAAALAVAGGIGAVSRRGDRE